MHSWYVLQVLSTHEKKVKKAIEDQLDAQSMRDFIEQVMVPTENVSEVKQGQQRIVEKRIWPGYLLIKMTVTDESWQYVKGTQGVIDFLGGPKPTALSDEEIEKVLVDLEKKKEGVTQRHQYKAGDRIKIIDGVFVNFMGTITEVFPEKGRLNAVVSIFGRDTPVDDLEFWQIEELDDEEVG